MSSPFDLLLEIQAIDTATDQLQHRRDHLAELGEIEAIKARAGALRNELFAAMTARDALASRQAILESEVETTLSRIAQIDARLYGTSINSAKDNKAMAEEVVHLRERQSSLENEDIEVMEALEPAQAVVDGLQTTAQKLAGEMKAAQQKLVAAQGELDAEINEFKKSRADKAPQIDSTLLAEYERLRGQLGGIAIAKLQGNQCGGCHITMSGGELDAIRKAPADSVVHCDECGRILVKS